GQVWGGTGGTASRASRRRGKARRAAQRCRLPVCVGQPAERALAPRRADERQAYRKAGDVARRHGHVGKARDRGRSGAPSQKVVAVDQVDRPRRIPGGRYESVQLLPVQERLEPVLARELAALVERIAVGLIAERSFVLRLEEQLLPEVGHLPLFIPLVVINDVMQRLHCRSWRVLEEIAIHIRL